MDDEFRRVSGKLDLVSEAMLLDSALLRVFCAALAASEYQRADRIKRVMMYSSRRFARRMAALEAVRTDLAGL